MLRWQAAFSLLEVDATTLGVKLSQFSKNAHSLEYMLSDLDLRPVIDSVAHLFSGHLEGMLPSGPTGWRSADSAPQTPRQTLKRKVPDFRPPSQRSDVVSRARLGDAPEREALRVCLRCGRESLFPVTRPAQASDPTHPQNWLFIKWSYACPLCGGLWGNSARLGSSE